MVSKSIDQIVICEKKYKVIETCSSSALRKVYKVRDEQNVTYFIKEVKKDSPSGTNELENNAAVILDQEAENNSNYFFQTEKLAETSTASYFRIITEAGDPLDRLREKWIKELSGEAFLSAITKLMIEVTKALEYMHSEKKLLHIDLKPQNIYALGKGVDRKVKLLDLGSALPLNKLNEDGDSICCVESTSKFQSPLLIKIMSLTCFRTKSNSLLLRKLFRELSVRDDIFALSSVMSYMLVGDPHAKQIVIAGCNRYCLKMLNGILSCASHGHYISACGEEFETSAYESVSLMRNDLEELSNALLGVGISKTLFLKKGENYIRQIMSEKGAYINGQYRIDDALIPAIRRKSDDGDNGEETVLNRITEVIDSEKKNLFIASEGGAGKTYLLWRTYLDYAERREMIPIYIPLNTMDYLENSLLYFIANEYTGYQCEDKARKVLSYCREHTEHRFLILADGLNEIPTTKPQNKRNAVNNLLELSELPNVSMVVASRREDIEFSGFEQYELAPLDEQVLREKMPYYNSLPTKLQQLLTTPFNLSLYLHLPEEYKDIAIETSTDLLEANINWLRDKLKEQGVLKGTIDFLFDLLLPVLSYQLNKNNSMIFKRNEFVSTANRWATIIGDDETEKYDDEIDAYFDICFAIKSTDHLTMKLTVKNLINYLADNAVIYRSIDGNYEFFHQNIRDYFAAKGWIFLVSHYLYLKALKLDNLEAYLTFSFDLHDYLNDLIRIESIKNQFNAFIETHTPQKRDFYEVLFDHTTRGLKHDETAQIFNRVIINTMKVLGTFTRVREEREEDYLHGNRDAFSAFFFHDFRNLDLSKVSFVDSCLIDCNFDGAVLSEKVFRHPTSKGTPDLLWNNDELVVMAYREGYVRCVSLVTLSVIGEYHTAPFDACFITDNRIFLCLNRCKIDKTMSVAELYVLDLTSGICLSRSELKISLNLLYQDQNLNTGLIADIFHEYVFFDGTDQASFYRIKEIYPFDDCVYAVFKLGMFRFRNTDGVYLCDDVLLLSDKNALISYSLCKQILPCNPVQNDADLEMLKHLFVLNADLSGRFFAVYQIDQGETVSDYRNNSFWLIDKEKSELGGGIRSIGPYCLNDFLNYGRLLDMRIVDRTVVALFLRDNQEQIHCFDEYMNEICVERLEYNNFVFTVSTPYMYPVLYRVNPGRLLLDQSQVKGIETLVCTSEMTTCIMSDGLLEIRYLIQDAAGSQSFSHKEWLSFVATRAEIGYQVDENLVSITTDHIACFNSMYNWKRAYDISTGHLVAYDRNSEYYLPEQDVVSDSSHLTFFSKYITEIRNEMNDKPIVQYQFDMAQIKNKIRWSRGNPKNELSESQIAYVANRYLLIPTVDPISLQTVCIDVIDTYDDSLIPVKCVGLRGVINRIIRLETSIKEQEGIIDRLITVVDNTLLELEINLIYRQCKLINRFEIFPDVWIEECSFDNTEIDIDESRYDKAYHKNELLRREKRKIIHFWESNTIISDRI